jgi:hypothetical protein
MGRRLPAGPASKPKQIQDCVARVSQARVHFSRLKTSIVGAKIAIEQLCDFRGRARLLDLVQGSNNVLVEAAVSIWNLTHLRLPGLRVDLRCAHFLRSAWR